MSEPIVYPEGNQSGTIYVNLTDPAKPVAPPQDEKKQRKETAQNKMRKASPGDKEK